MAESEISHDSDPAPTTALDPEAATATEMSDGGEPPDSDIPDEEHKAEPKPEPLFSQPSFQEAVGAAIFSSRIDNLHLGDARKNFAPQVLHSDTLQEMRDTYVRIDRDGTDKAGEVERILRREKIVVLVGGAGTGRRTTAINAILAIGLHPAQILLDPDNLDRSLITRKGQGNVIDLGETKEEIVPRLSNALRDYVARTRAAESCLVIIATSRECQLLDPDDNLIVSIVGPSPESVFRSHLACATSKLYADQYAESTKIKEALQSATTREASRLASLAKKNANTSEDISPEQIEDVLTEFYKRATADLKNTFDYSNADASDYDRALLLAVAALEGARPEVIFSAVEQLVERLELDVYPGHGRFGPGVSELLVPLGAELVDGVVKFRQPDHAMPVLDYVWDAHVYLRKHLDPWLISLGDDYQSEQVSAAILQLAVSHNIPELVTNAVASWTGKRASKLQAVQLLTAAALSSTIGRSVRHSLYEWSTVLSTPEEVQIAVAEVCGGILGRAFPDIAMTRLRHLAGRSSLRVRGTVCAALTQLVMHGHLHNVVLTEIVGWGDSSPDRQTTGALAFATLAQVHMDEHLLLLPDSSLDEELLSLLAQGWRATLRNQETTAGAFAIAASWLEAAAQASAPSHAIIEIFSMTCRSSYDIGIVLPLARRWARDSHQPSAIPRELIYEALLAKVGEFRPDLWGQLSLDIYRRL
ncbi:hypothetical protein ACIBI7_51705 [Nonomuraea fuscirosea]|uniref:hypothetical protein n=1 Tax=Nonomuraea fuscirosea TaxID=1291556 RepID=UPI00378B2E66